MPANIHPEEQDPDLPPPGQRWGAGAHSVLPYLTKTLQARPANAPEPREHASRDSGPLFPDSPVGAA